MSFKKLVSGIASLTIAVSAFAALGVTASAATNTLLELGTTDVPWTAENITQFSGTVPTLDATYGATVSGGNGSYESTKSITPTANSIITVDAEWYGVSNTGRSFEQGNNSYFRFGNIYVMENDQDRASAYSLVGQTSAPTTFSNGGFVYRVGSLSASVVPYKIHMVIDTATNVLTSFTIDGTSNAVTLSNTELSNTDYLTVGFGYKKTGSVSTTNYEALKSIKITEKTQEVSTADYTVNYYLGEATDNNLVKTESKSGVVGTDAVFSTDPFDKNDQRYYCVSNDGSGKTIAADGTTVVNVIVREAYTFTASLTSSIDKSEIGKKENVVEGDSASIFYNRYVLVGNQGYSTSPNNQTYSQTLTYDTPTKEIVYTAITDFPVVYYNEAENIDVLTKRDDTARMSGGAGAYASAEGTEVTTLQPGKYLVLVGARSQSSATPVLTASVGTTEILNETVHGYWAELMSSPFSVTEPTALTFKSENNNANMDYILIYKIGNLTPINATNIGAFTGANNTKATAFKATLGDATGSISFTATSNGNSKTWTSATTVSNANVVLGIIVPDLDDSNATGVVTVE